MGLLKAIFNEKELPIMITKVNRNITPSFTNETVSIGSAKGEIFQYNVYKSKQIEISYQIYNRRAEYLVNFRRGLSALIYTDEPKKLIFSDEPNIYYNAILDGEQTLEEEEYKSSGILRFLIPDGVAHSVAEKTAENYGSNQITLENNGTESVPINIKTTMKSDNGYIAFTLGDRFYQIGKPEEVDGKHYEESVKLFDDHLYEDKGWLVNQGITPPVTSERLQNGVVKYVKESTNEGYATTKDYGSGNSWHGASLTKIVPKDVNNKYPVNWKVAYRFDFNTDGAVFKGVQVGHTSVTMIDENDDIICSIIFEDTSPVNEYYYMAVFIGNKNVWHTDSTFPMAKKGVTARGDYGPAVTAEKIGNQVTIRFNNFGICKTFYVDNPEVELRKITWYGAAYKDHFHTENNVLRALHVIKHNVDRYEDIPNYFSNGDIVEIDGASGSVYINDAYDTDVADIGSQPLLLPPGQHTLGIITSSFASVPDVEVTYQERWI
ncbi:phage tail family protein [Sellimonas intestinalis]|uniref:distal tail protein Dit n=1 Tax=Sellimonas intestinalis TaxID=1653434 RepID=UPI000E415EBC|nr:distal tail protein Dit [Sellimonas intestinalis]RGE52467.1 phage tail family protein [Sellimonas intestinalis]